LPDDIKGLEPTIALQVYLTRKGPACGCAINTTHLPRQVAVDLWAVAYDSIARALSVAADSRQQGGDATFLADVMKRIDTLHIGRQIIQEGTR
jgi:hypothetical protein